MSLQNIIGGLIFSAGAILLFIAFNMDVSVVVNYASENSYGLPEKVNNLGLMQEKQNKIIFGSILAFVGFLIIVLEKPKEKDNEVEIKKSLSDNLIELKELLDNNHITQEEYENQKKKALS